MPLAGFETKSVRMQRLFLIGLVLPSEDVGRIMQHAVAITPLVMGSYDSNAFQSADGIERYRPLSGAVVEPESELRKRPGVVEVSFEIPSDQAVLERVIETIYEVHSYQDPVIRLQEVFSSRTKGLDDKQNPYRWWNTTADWKKAG